jgi:hypothetical protein
VGNTLVEANGQGTANAGTHEVAAGFWKFRMNDRSAEKVTFHAGLLR